MAPNTKALTTKPSEGSPYQLDSAQTLRATNALQRKLQTDQLAVKETGNGKVSLLADADEVEQEDEVPVWLVLTTKKHIIDKKRLKPGKISLPNPYLDYKSERELRICLITADPQRQYKDLIASPAFPLDLAKRISRVIGTTKLKAKYKSYESRRQLLGEYDVFLADDRIITQLPTILGKVFYKSSSKRPVPISLEGRRESKDEQGNKRVKLAEGGSKVTRCEVQPSDVAHEIERAIGSALVHLAPSTTTAVKIGLASQTPAQLQGNVEAVVEGLVEKYVPQKWRNVRAIHIKGPETAALPIWLASELWETEEDVLDEPLLLQEGKKRKRGALTAGGGSEESATVIEVPGPDGKMRMLEAPSKIASGDNGAEKSKKKRKGNGDDEVAAKATEKAEKEARKSALKKQKEDAKAFALKGSSKAKKAVSAA
ncbi:ribosomal protein L1 [Polychaeton citri CBS 116435]|uniref:Ribosomal protein L1 n=1 Tax=Polychaeton citri CBS 116435 TaxID=1314669 RepID=A0A9P4QB60_9PEZI|nr:ribosomal protein L1 [Polychaeton citri CBS 116435]